MLSYFKSWIKKIRNYILYISFYEIFHKEKPKWLNDGLISSHFFGARNDEEFKSALNESRKILNHSLYNEWRLYSATMIVKMILDRKITKNEIFNYVECGVGIGMTLFIISKYIEKFDPVVIVSVNAFGALTIQNAEIGIVVVPNGPTPSCPLNLRSKL